MNARCDESLIQKICKHTIRKKRDVREFKYFDLRLFKKIELYLNDEMKALKLQSIGEIAK